MPENLPDLLIDLLPVGLASLVLFFSLVRFATAPRHSPDAATAAQNVELQPVIGSVVVLKKIEFYGSLLFAFSVVLLYSVASALGVPEPKQFWVLLFWLALGYAAIWPLLLIWRAVLKRKLRHVMERAASVTVTHDTLSPFWHEQVVKFVDRRQSFL